MSKSFKHINPKKILFEFEEDFDIFEELIEDYKTQFGDLFSTLKASVESQDGKQLKISAHTLKGIVSNFYAEDFKEAAFKLETAGENNDFTETLDEFLKFKNLNEEVILELEEFVKSFNAGTYQAA